MILLSFYNLQKILLISKNKLSKFSETLVTDIDSQTICVREHVANMRNLQMR